MTPFVAIDPGVKYFAWALFVNGRLDKADLCRTDNDFYWIQLRIHSLKGVPLAVVECPALNFGVPQKDILDLARAAGEIGIQFPERIYVTPSQWKGSVPKAIHQQRIVTRLDDTERAVIPPTKTAQKHVLDAIGIGLWRLGRM